MIKITPTREQLETLLNLQDPQVRVEFTNTVIQSFTNKHLKGIVNHDLVKQAEQNIRRDFTRLAEDLVLQRVKAGLPREYALSDNIKTLVNVTLEKEIGNLVKEQAKELEDRLAERFDRFQALLETKLKNVFDKLDQQIEDKLEEIELKFQQLDDQLSRLEDTVAHREQEIFDRIGKEFVVTLERKK